MHIRFPHRLADRGRASRRDRAHLGRGHRARGAARGGYNDPRNAGVRSFLLHVDGALVGDGDVRGLRDGAAEFAFMIAAPNIQGKGLGTRFAVMIHAFGFVQLGLERIYASVVPHNVASRRVFEKMGYQLDDGPEARGYADEPGDVTLVIDRATFERNHALALAQIQIASRH